MKMQLPEDQPNNENRKCESGGDPASEAFSALVRKGLQSYPTSPVDEQRLSRLLRDEFAKSEDVPAWKRWFASPVFKPAVAVSALVVAFSLIAWFSLKNEPFNPVVSVRFISSLDQSEQTPPNNWESAFAKGEMVTTPKERLVTLQLAHGSVVECSPQTTLAVQFNKKRMIHLLSGAVAISASPMPEMPLTVKTPVADVEVIGTVFYVRIIPSNKGE